MHVPRLAAIAVVVLALGAPAWAQEPLPAEGLAPAETLAAAPNGAELAQIPGPGRPLTGIPAITPAEPNLFKLIGSDFKNFFTTDTAYVLGYASVAAVAAAPWDRQGVNNGFNIPTTLFESGNLVGQFAFQVGAGFATYGVGKVAGNQKLAVVGRDLVRAQVVSQVFVQGLKATIRRERPDASSNNSFPSGHSAAGFATATVLQQHYGWKVGVPAYALGSYIALARMAWNRHHATDVVMGAGFGIAAGRTVTMSVAKTKFNMGVRPEAGGASVTFTKINK